MAVVLDLDMVKMLAGNLQRLSLLKNRRIQMSKIGILEKLMNMRFVEEDFDEINQEG